MFPIETLINFVVVIIFLFFWMTTFIILYHLTRFGIGTLPKKLSAIFLIGGVTLFSISIILFSRIDLATLIT